MDAKDFFNQRLLGGFLLKEISFTAKPLVDGIGREAIAQTTINGCEFRLLICAGLSVEELSITLYHEVLEAATVSSFDPPASVTNLNEAGFEQAAQTMHARWGAASPVNLNRMLHSYGFA